MENNTCINRLSSNISALRKKHGLTQEGLADKLGITFQAVSKWENGLSSPDIQLLPELSAIFRVSVDELLGIQREIVQAAPPTAPQEIFSSALPWKDDEALRAVVFKGHRLLQSFEEESGEFTFTYDGEALNVESFCAIKCESIMGNATAGSDIHCNAIGGNADAGGDVNCNHIGGSTTAGGDIHCSHISGDVNAGGDIRCIQIVGNAMAGGDIHYDNPQGEGTEKAE